jgi:hypothetical protein
MAQVAEKMVRKQFLVPPSMAKRLEQIAAERGISAFVRQAIESFDATGAQDMAPTDLMDLVSARLKDAIRSTRRAQRTVSKTLATLSDRTP